MAFDANDIDIFVLTYNRASLLPATLHSLLEQSMRGASVTVLDNASVDATEAAVFPFLAKGVRYERASANLGWEGNLARAINMACRAWTMVFHDDDLLHPHYLQYALDVINSMPNLGLLVSTMSFESVPENTTWHQAPINTELCPDPSDLAAWLYAGAPIHFGSAIYRTEVLKTLKWESDVYGKIADRPFLLAAARGYASLIFCSPMVHYRIHAQQDSMSQDSGPFVPQLAALHRCYRAHLGENPLSRRGRCFLRHNYRSIRDEFPRLCKADKLKFSSLRDYKNFMIAQGGSSRFSLVSGHVIAAWCNLWCGFFSCCHAMVRKLRLQRDN